MCRFFLSRLTILVLDLMTPKTIIRALFQVHIIKISLVYVKGFKHFIILAMLFFISILFDRDITFIALFTFPPPM